MIYRNSMAVCFGEGIFLDLYWQSERLGCSVCWIFSYEEQLVTNNGE